MQATRLPLQRQSTNGFTLTELVVTVGVLVLLVLLATQLLKSAATVTTLGHKQMDADSQARQLLDRMAVDFAQMIKRSDVNYYWKGGTGGSQIGNDQMAFYCAVPGYYSTTTSTTQSPISLIAYRINAQNKAERLGKGLLWNGVSLAENPLVFWQPIAAPTDADYTTSGEVVAPQVFRFEYCYLLTNGFLSITPPASISGIAAIIVDIAAIDPRSRVLLNDAQITTLAGQLSDYNASMIPGQLRNTWQNTINAATLPRPALSGIRVYERFFYLSPPSL
jgi:type II secretory pathway pseudopilin PulG